MFRHLRLAVAALALAIAAGTVPHSIAAQDQAIAVYVVQMEDQPVLAYTGGIPGRAATKPALREKIDPDSPAIAGYARYLEGRHDRALARVGAHKIYAYRFAFNGFAARLTEAQAAALKSTPGVLRVMKDELVTMDTSSTPRFLGLDEPGGLWDQLAGPDRAGENIVIGIVDSGVWPESLSFTDRVDRHGDPAANGRLAYHDLRRWHGRCERGEAFKRSDCNNKLIGARHYNAAWGGDEGIDEELPWEFTSPRDYNGHGTHTASTAGGNHDVKLTGDAAPFGRISGIAPRARIAVYKALWSTEDGSQANGFNSDLVAAIDQAVADGVDVINYSVSGTRTNFIDPVEVAFLNAADAGVFVSASAGNSGPANFTVAHPSPWITTVAAGTHDRTGVGSVTLGNGATFTGASVANAVGPLPLIDSTAAAVAGADPAEAALCFAAADNAGVPVLDPAKVAGKIVLCDRGVNARVNKSLAVKEAGGAGMILVNVTPGTVDPDFHYVPSIHLADTHRAALKAYAATPNPTARIAQGIIVFDKPAPFTATFSSRGPLLAGNGDILKPDVIAPGQDIMASVAPPANSGRDFNVYSGTSMSAPHVAGLAALLMDLHPRWSPMAVKSAMMTSAGDVLDGPNTAAVVIFRQGAGHIDPTRAADPGLVFDSNAFDWLAFLCGQVPADIDPRDCAGLQFFGFSFDASDLNSASIAIGDLAGIQTVRRRVKNVGGSTATYTPTVAGMAGVTVEVTPATLTLGPGETKSFTVKFTRTTAPVNAYVGGQLTFSDGNHNVRIPMVVLPVALAAPAQVSGTGGPISYNVTFGYSGPFAATARGLIPATLRPGTVSDDPDDTFDLADTVGLAQFPVTIPAGTTYARFSLFDESVSPASDLDLRVYRIPATGAPVLVAASGNATSNEEANLVNPPAGNYVVYVHGFSAPPAPATASFTLHEWLLGTASAGNMTVSAPATAVNGGSGTINLTFSPLTAGTKYLGSVAYSNGTAEIGTPTIVRVDP